VVGFRVGNGRIAAQQAGGFFDAYSSRKRKELGPGRRQLAKQPGTEIAPNRRAHSLWNIRPEAHDDAALHEPLAGTGNHIASRSCFDQSRRAASGRSGSIIGLIVANSLTDRRTERLGEGRALLVGWLSLIGDRDDTRDDREGDRDSENKLGARGHSSPRYADFA
jgi:hypothetical protein